MQNKSDDKVILSIIKKLQEGEGTDEQVAKWFSNQLADLHGLSDLIFYPSEDLTPEQILEKCRPSTKVIVLKNK
jgi:hypothetical protein